MRYFVSCRVRNLERGLDAPVTEHGKIVEAETPTAAFTLWICGESHKDAWLRCSVEDFKRLLATDRKELAIEGFEGGGTGSMDWETGDLYRSENIVQMSGTACSSEFEFEVVVLPANSLPAELTTDAISEIADDLDEVFDKSALDDAMTPYFDKLLEKIADEFDLTHAQFETLENRLSWNWILLRD